MHGKVLADFGLPNAKDLTDELEVEKSRYDCKIEQEIFDELTRSQPLNEEQQLIFDTVSIYFSM